MWIGAYPATAPIVNLARGTEVYDVDHNGYIDHMTIFFDKPVDLNGVTNASFTIGSSYTLTGTPATEFDAGGVGIRNAGELGVTVSMIEKEVYDTNVKPELTYNATNILRAVGGADAGSVGSAQSIEVDKARPILISAVTKDTGIGTGTASNGIIDGLVFTFSEPIRNVRAGAALSANGASATGFINMALPVATGMSFNQGNGTSSANVHTIPVQETTINTGVTPDVNYNEDATTADVRISDFATAATGSISYNLFYATNTSFAVADAIITTTDGAPMVVHSVETLDSNANGRIDQIRVTFSEVTAAAISHAGVDFYSSTAAFASGANANGVYTPTAVSGASSTTLTFTITEVSVANVYDTEAAPLFRYDPNGALPGPPPVPANIADATGNDLAAYGPGGLSHAATKDMAAPVIVKFTTTDAYSDTAYVGDSSFEAAGANGRIDQITIVYSEKVVTGEGAQLGGTALDHAVGQFTITHPDGGARVKTLTTATLGKPAWTDKDANGDTSTEIVVPFQEVSFATAGLVNKGDTGKIPTLAYAASGTSAYNVKDAAPEPNLFTTILGGAGKDGAKPFVVDGLGYGALAFANITTKDTPVTAPAPIPAGVSNSADGDGFIDAYILNFSEAVVVASGTSNAFTVDLPGAGALTFAGANTTVAVSVVTVAGTNDKKSGADTATAPAISFNDGTQVINDLAAAPNKAASFTGRGAYDGAPAVIVAVNGDTAAANKLNFTFSEPVFAHNAEGLNISFNATSVASSSLFGYDNLGAGPGSSGFTAAVVTQPSANVLQATMNANLTVVDIASDLVWVRTSTVFDDANANNAALADNVTLADVAGANLKFWIMDDVVAPWIVGARTIDHDLDGKIDHIKITLSEPIDDSTIKGFVSANALSNDVATTWILSGYTGPVRWNFFDGTQNVGKQAAIDAGEPAFADNDTDDAVLYLKLDEELVPVNTNSGAGTTGFKPTITWGTGADAETLGDFRPNLLNTAKNAADVDDALGLEPTNGAVADKVGPAIVGATISGKDITVLFSEPVKKTADVKYAEYFLVDAASNKIWGLSWTNNSTVVLTMKPDYSFSGAAATTVAVNPAAPDLTDLADTQDPANPAGLAADVVSGLWTAASPASNVPYAASTTARGVFKVTNNTWITFTDIADASPAANESVRIRWTFANVDSVDVYVSFNGGETYELVPGSRTAASVGAYFWTAKLGVTNVKIQSATSSANFTVAVAPVFDGSVVGGSVGAPSALTIMDMPNDNGGFVIAKFKVSADNLTAVKSYQFYRTIVVGTDTLSVQWATVPAGAPDANGFMAVIVPTIDNNVSQWKVCASTGTVVTLAAAKEAEVPVAEVVYDGGAAKAAASEVISAMSEVVVAASVDNIAPSAFTATTASAGNGVEVSWVAPADHGIVGSFTLNGAIGYIYGVDKYEVYRKTGTGEFALVGEATKGSTQFVDTVAAGSTIYNYMIKALDSAHTVDVAIPGNVMSLSGVAGDFTGDSSVGLGDLVILGNYWDVKSTDANFVGAIDLNKDGAIGLGDLVLLGNAWTPASKVAKAAPAPGVAFDMNAEYNADNSTYFVTVNAQDAAGINGIGFTLKYDAEKYEFVSDAISGLSSDVKVIKADQAGIVSIASYYGSDKFDGTITLGFKAKGQISEMNVEMVNAEAAINGVIGSVSNATVTLKAVPTVYALSQNFPNPFNPTTTIEYSIPKAGHTTLAIYNVAGQKVRTLINESQAASFYKVVWDGRNDNGESVATGMYFYKLVSGNYSKIVKMTLMK
ncbi:MAG: FlgD immunoglobulin-like domain containing protein [Candidatus Latescibacterota bacterium]